MSFIRVRGSLKEKTLKQLRTIQGLPLKNWNDVDTRRPPLLVGRKYTRCSLNQAWSTRFILRLSRSNLALAFLFSRGISKIDSSLLKKKQSGMEHCSRNMRENDPKSGLVRDVISYRNHSAFRKKRAFLLFLVYYPHYGIFRQKDSRGNKKGRYRYQTF